MAGLTAGCDATAIDPTLFACGYGGPCEDVAVTGDSVATGHGGNDNDAAMTLEIAELGPAIVDLPSAPVDAVPETVPEVDTAVATDSAPELPPPCSSTPGACDDGNPCTDDQCQPEAGCVHPLRPEGASCALGGVVGKCNGAECVPPWAREIAAGSRHVCVVRSNSTLACWGDNAAGQASQNAETVVLAPAQVVGAKDVAGVAAGGDTTCAWSLSGKLMCFGDDALGQTGTGSPLTTVFAPTTVPDLTEVTAADVGVSHACAVAGGKVFCWGRQDSGQLGDGTPPKAPPMAPLPLAVSGIVDAVEVAVGDAHSCAVRKGGTAACWGLGGSGQLGNGKTASSAVPVAVTVASDFLTVSAGVSDVHAIRQGGAVARWGWSLYSESPASWSVPEVKGLMKVTDLDVGLGHACVTTAAGTALCWGDNTLGQLGRITTADLDPVPGPAAIPKVKRVAVGKAFTCVLRTDGAVQCVGDGTHGELGDGAGTSSKKPVLVKGSSPASP